MLSDSLLEQYRDYLSLLGRLQLDEHLAGKVDVSGVVQITMLEAYQQATTWESFDEEARTAWLRRVFANNLLDEIRRFRAQSRDVFFAEFRLTDPATAQQHSRRQLLYTSPHVQVGHTDNTGRR